MSEQYVSKEDFAQMTETMGEIQEVTLRVDERVNILLERQSVADATIHEIRNVINSLVSRVAILESRNENKTRALVDKSRDKIHEIEKQIQLLFLSNNNNEAKWKTIFDFVGKVLWIIVAAYVLYKLGYNPPPIS